MLKYDIRSGVKKIKTKTAIVISAVTLSASGLGMAVVVPAVSHAAGPGYSPPPAAQNSCDSGHGAFAAFSDPSQHGHPGDVSSERNGQPPYFGDDQLGSARAGATGAAQKATAEACNQ